MRKPPQIPQDVVIVDIFDGWKVLCEDRLNAARERLPKEYRTFKKMSELTKISIPQLNKYFKGREVPNLKNLKKICLYLQVPSDFLLGLKVEKLPKNI